MDTCRARVDTKAVTLIAPAASGVSSVQADLTPASAGSSGSMLFGRAGRVRLSPAPRQEVSNRMFSRIVL